jgi:hypothetical protein
MHLVVVSACVLCIPHSNVHCCASTLARVNSIYSPFFLFMRALLSTCSLFHVSLLRLVEAPFSYPLSSPNPTCNHECSRPHAPPPHLIYPPHSPVSRITCLYHSPVCLLLLSLCLPASLVVFCSRPSSFHFYLRVCPSNLIVVTPLSSCLAYRQSL